jgi:transposase
MWCGSTINGKFVNRDLNAALNIRRCLISLVRPVELCRVVGQGKLYKVVGKRIRC